jgi:hypothetical protein
MATTNNTIESRGHDQRPSTKPDRRSVTQPPQSLGFGERVETPGNRVAPGFNPPQDYKRRDKVGSREGGSRKSARMRRVPTSGGLKCLVKRSQVLNEAVSIVAIHFRNVGADKVVAEYAELIHSLASHWRSIKIDRTAR